MWKGKFLPKHSELSASSKYTIHTKIYLIICDRLLVHELLRTHKVNHLTS